MDNLDSIRNEPANSQPGLEKKNKARKRLLISIVFLLLWVLVFLATILDWIDLGNKANILVAVSFLFIAQIGYTMVQAFKLITNSKRNLTGFGLPK